MESDRVEIFTASVLERAKEIGVDVDAQIRDLMHSHPFDVFRFPDGSLQLRSAAMVDSNERFRRPILDAETKELFGDWSDLKRVSSVRANQTLFGESGYVCLKEFSTELVYICYYGAWVARLDAHGFPIATAAVELSREECPLDNFDVRVGFQRTPSKRVGRRFAEHLANWLATVSQGGIGGEGPVRLISNEVEIVGVLARFSLDISHTGQNTVNWLIIGLAAFCEVSAIENVYFTTGPGSGVSFEEAYGLSKHKARRYPLGKATTSSDDTHQCGDAVEASKVKTTIRTGDATMNSELFPVRFSPADHSGAVVSVVVDRSRQPSDVENMRLNIESWRSVGECGGFGGNGFGRCTDIIFLPEEHSFRWYVDFGSADLEMAIRCLIWICESWSVTEVPVDEIRVE